MRTMVHLALSFASSPEWLHVVAFGAAALVLASAIRRFTRAGDV